MDAPSSSPSVHPESELCKPNAQGDEKEVQIGDLAKLVFVSSNASIHRSYHLQRPNLLLPSFGTLEHSELRANQISCWYFNWLQVLATPND